MVVEPSPKQAIFRGALMEHCALNVARDHLKSGLSISPMLSGFSGSSNRPYFDLSLGFLDQNLPCWFS